jgi:hypothetical protein
LRRAALVGAVAGVGAFVSRVGIPPARAALDLFIWLLFGGVALFGALLGAGIVLAWRNLRHSRAPLLWATVGLLLLSVPIVWPFLEERRRAAEFLAAADSTRGVVVNKFVRGGVRLVVDFHVGNERHRVLTPGKPSNDQWALGDSVWVFFLGTMPDSASVGHPGPDRAAMLRELAWLWGLGSVLLTAYLPAIVRVALRLHAARKGQIRGSPASGRSQHG